MITIIIDGKTYIPNGENGEEAYRVQFESEICKGFLEEVKENKEHPGTICEFLYTDTPYTLETLTPGQAKDFIETPTISKMETTEFTPGQEEPKKKIEKLKIEYTLDGEKRGETMINLWTPTPGQEIVLSEETKKLMCDFADWYHNGLLNRERRSPEEELDKFLISK